jgi:hypothetical protein
MIVECTTHGTTVEYNRTDCGQCADKTFRDSHNGVDQVTDFIYPGLSSWLAGKGHEVYEHSYPNPGELEAMRNEWDSRDEVLYPAWLERDSS